jgi:hypothetical protein
LPAATLPFVGSSLSMERGMLYGVSARTQEPIIVDPSDDRFDNYHLAVMAPTGSGKSYFVKLQALRSLLSGTDYLVVDPEKGVEEYLSRDWRYSRVSPGQSCATACCCTAHTAT